MDDFESQVVGGLFALSLVCGLVCGLLWGAVCSSILKSKGYTAENYEKNDGFIIGLLLGLVGGFTICFLYGLFWGIVGGLLIGSLAAIICGFRPKVRSKEEREKTGGLNYDYNKTNEPLSKSWVCNCGGRNDENNSHCGKCGKPRYQDRSVKMDEIALPQKQDEKGSSISEQIRELGKLKEEGLITEEEFEAKKKKILDI